MSYGVYNVPIVSIGRSNSTCLNCGKPCSPYDSPTHDINLGYNKNVNGTPGCGIKWEYWVSEYQGIDTSSWGPKGLPEWPQGKDFDQYGKD